MSDSDSDEVDDSVIASAMSNMRTKAETKSRYKSGTQQAKLWFAQHHPECLDGNGEIKISIPTTVVRDYLASICRQGYMRNLVKDGAEIPEGQADPVSYSKLNNHRSALKDLYRDKNIKPTDEVEHAISTIVVGYQKLLNDLRKR
jgi:hypothetical protein